MMNFTKLMILSCLVLVAVVSGANQNGENQGKIRTSRNVKANVSSYITSGTDEKGDFITFSQDIVDFEWIYKIKLMGYNKNQIKDSGINETILDIISEGAEALIQSKYCVYGNKKFKCYLQEQDNLGLVPKSVEIAGQDPEMNRKLALALDVIGYIILGLELDKNTLSYENLWEKAKEAYEVNVFIVVMHVDKTMTVIPDVVDTFCAPKYDPIFVGANKHYGHIGETKCFDGLIYNTLKYVPVYDENSTIFTV